MIKENELMTKKAHDGRDLQQRKSFFNDKD